MKEKVVSFLKEKIYWAVFLACTGVFIVTYFVFKGKSLESPESHITVWALTSVLGFFFVLFEWVRLQLNKTLCMISQAFLGLFLLVLMFEGALIVGSNNVTFNASLFLQNFAVTFNYISSIGNLMFAIPVAIASYILLWPKRIYFYQKLAKGQNFLFLIVTITIILVIAFLSYLSYALATMLAETSIKDKGVIEMAVGTNSTAMDIVTLGSFGDSFGIVTAIFTAFSFIGLMLTLHYQRQELQAQRDEIKTGRDIQKDEFLMKKLEVVIKEIVENFDTLFKIIDLNYDESSIKRFCKKEDIKVEDLNSYKVNNFQSLFLSFEKLFSIGSELNSNLNKSTLRSNCLVEASKMRDSLKNNKEFYNKFFPMSKVKTVRNLRTLQRFLRYLFTFAFLFAIDLEKGFTALSLHEIKTLLEELEASESDIELIESFIKIEEELKQKLEEVSSV